MDSDRLRWLTDPAVDRRASSAWRDRVLVGLVAVPVVGSGLWDGQALTVLSGAIGLAAIPLRRRHPLSALLLALAVAAARPADGALVMPALVVLYAIALHETWSPIALATTAVLGGASMVWLCWGHDQGRHGTVSDLAAAGALCAAAVIVGLYRGSRGRVRDGLADRAARVARERKLLTERAVADERLRIAQELHDVVAHNVSLMVVQAQALGATVADGRVLEGTDAIADLGRRAMEEMHRTLHLLRTDGPVAAELSPQPGLADLDGLLEHSRAAGLPVDLVIEGKPRQLSQSADLSAFRIVQEALTNVLKHAGTSRTTVALAYGPDLLNVSVIDDGSDRSPESGQLSGGHGLMGMRERVGLFGGSVAAGPRAGHGFEVCATLPYDASAP